MSLRFKLLLFFSVILTVIVSLLFVNAHMARKKNEQMTRLLWIHHQYSSLLNLKIAVSLQMNEAQEIFVYGKEAELQSFQDTTELVKKEVNDLVVAEDRAGSVNPQARDTSAEVRDEGNRLVQLQHSYEDLYRELLLLNKLMQVGRSAKAGEYYKKEILGRFMQFFALIDQWIAVDEKKLTQVEDAFVLLSSRHNLAFVVGLSGILLMVLGSFVLFVSVLGPRMRELYQGTERIAHGDFSQPVREVGNDEFTNFGRAMNQMMVSLAESRKKLLEQSYYSGMADMVSGVLHNVKNSLAPVLIDIEDLQNRCRNLTGKKIGPAIKELSHPSLTAEKRQDYLEYLQLASSHLDEQSGEFQKNLSHMKNKIELIEKVLNEHNVYSNAERPVEVIRISELMQESLALVPNEYLENVEIAIQYQIPEETCLKTQRIVFIQVLANLIMNGVESIQRNKTESGRVVVTVQQEPTADAAHLVVADNGEGIAAERLTEIFQRGVSSKAGSYGLGLHWCANAVASLNGRLYAESAGEGQGACLHCIVER